MCFYGHNYVWNKTMDGWVDRWIKMLKDPRLCARVCVCAFNNNNNDNNDNDTIHKSLDVDGRRSAVTV